MLQNYGTVAYKQATVIYLVQSSSSGTMVTRKTESAGHQGMDGPEQCIHTFSVENEALLTYNLTP